MKSFLIKIGYFFIPIVVLSFPVDAFLSKNLKKGKSGYAVDEYSVWNDIYSGDVKSEIAIYGSSRAWRHINPNIFNDSLQLDAYNFGIDGNRFLVQSFRYNQFLKYNSKPSQIIYSVDIWTLMRQDELYNYEQYLPYMLFDKDFYYSFIDIEGFTFFDYFLPLQRYVGESGAINQAIRNFLFPSNTVYRENGFRGTDKSWNSDFDKVKSEMNIYSVQLDSNAISIFDDFLNDCALQNINVVLVYTPEYIDGQKFVKNRHEIMSYYQLCAEKYDFIFLDYSDDKMCLNKDLFYNSQHLNKKGADLFTLRLISDLIELDVF